MGRAPRSQRPREHKPSPLQQVHLTRPLSSVSSEALRPEVSSPEMGLVRDPMFWKRFSVAVHDAESGHVIASETGRGARSNSGSSGGTLGKYGDDWLGQQAREKRRCRINCMSITLIIGILITAGAICGWYFTKVHKIKIST